MFACLPDAELGSREDLGWFGLLKHGNRPGGVILHENPFGRRTAGAAHSDEELAQARHQLQEKHDAYAYATQYRQDEQEHGRAADSAPRIWIGSLADYTAGHLHGAWLDAVLEPHELEKAVQFVLRNAREPGAEEYGIFDYDGFGHGIAALIGEYSSLKLVSRLAEGIAEHGEAFAAWAACVGPEQPELLDRFLDRFEDHFLGEHASIEAYVDDALAETGFYRELDEALSVIPEDLRRYIVWTPKGWGETGGLRCML